jgi:uncharacterized membrane protein
MRLPSVTLLLCWLCNPAIAEEMVGTAYTSSFEIAGKQIPLPDGQWRVIAERNEPAGAVPASLSDLRQVILVQLQGPVASAIVVATANIGPSTTGWGTSRDCTRQDILMATLRYQSAVDVSCSFINHVVSAVADQPSVMDEELARRSKAEGWSIPATWLMAGFRIADRRDMIDVRYHFNPELIIPSRSAGPWQDNPWSRPAVSASRNRAAVVASLSNWVSASREMLEEGFRHRLPAGTSLPRPWGDGPSGASEPSTTLLELSHVVDADWATSLKKTISWRVVAAFADIAIAYAFTGSVVLSGALALTGSVVKSVFYFGHEVVWDALDPSGRKQPPILEVAGIGSTI